MKKLIAITLLAVMANAIDTTPTEDHYRTHSVDRFPPYISTTGEPDQVFPEDVVVEEDPDKDH